MPAHHFTRALTTTATAVALAFSLGACGGGSAAGGASGAAASSGQSGKPAATTSAHDMDMGLPSEPPVTPGPAATGKHNEADVSFASGMIPHHGQAVVMADMVLTRGENAKVKSMATTMKKDQNSEIATMMGWLKGWNEDVPADPYAHAAGMPGMSHMGMLSAEEMGKLKDAMGADADKAFLSGMIKHHEGAMGMAKTALTQAANPATKKLAQSIITTQTAEITQMKALLATMK